jgi:hypothetical protein
MTQDRIGPGAEHRGDPTTPTTPMRMTDGIDAPVDPAQLSPREPVLDRPSPHSKASELLTTYDAVLSLGEIPNVTVEQARETLSMPDMGNVRLGVHGPDLGRSRRADGALDVTYCNPKEAPARRYRLWL